MGYDAYGSGSIDFKRPLNRAQYDTISKLLTDEYYEHNFSMNGTYVDLYFDSKYHDDSTAEMLVKIADTAEIRDGYLHFMGEDDTPWAFEFRNGKWEELDGHIYYGPFINNDDRAEFIGRFIDLFEDFLEEKGIDIQNEDKMQSESPAIIYGMDYDKLQSGIENVLIRWGVISNER